MSPKKGCRWVKKRQKGKRMKEKGKKENRTGQGRGRGLPLRTWHRTIDKKQKNFTRGRHVFECVIDRDRQREGWLQKIKRPKKV